MGQLLDRINFPADLKGLDIAELEQLCGEIRAYMLECCAVNPGHVASSLGAVELTVGFHYVFDAPEDKIVFDVGHQAYAHKILTGRKEAFSRNRQKDGISGFPKRDESEYDAFGVGHSSTSISAALGLAEASRKSGRNWHTVALIGDGALTGGLAFEGLNNAGGSDADLLVIVNDNNQSIDGNLGGLHNHLLKLTTSPFYNRVKDKVWNKMGQTRTRNFFQRWIRSFKSWLVKKTGGDLFESLGMRYFGPIDGNDIAEVVGALKKLKDMKGPRILHCYTVKGKGFAPAEADPTTWHAPGKFDPISGRRFPSPHPYDRYQDVFGAVLLELARKDSRIIGITPAMATGCGMTALAKELPGQFYDVGIEEEHAVTFSAGLAAGGMKPFCNIYSSFSQRAYDQIIHDVALQHLPVVICLDRAGLVGEDGATHHGAFDLAAYRSIPGATIVVPKDEAELKRAMYTGAAAEEGPYIIRYPRGMGEGTLWRECDTEPLAYGKGEMLRDGSWTAVLTLGPFAYRALEAAEEFEKETGTKVAVYDMRFMKPLDTSILEETMSRFKNILTVEDGCLAGGLFGAVSEYAVEHHPGVNVTGIGIPDEFVIQASQREERKACGLDTEGILEKLHILHEKD